MNKRIDAERIAASISDDQIKDHINTMDDAGRVAAQFMVLFGLDESAGFIIAQRLWQRSKSEPM